MNNKKYCSTSGGVGLTPETRMLSGLLLHILIVEPPKLEAEVKGQYADSIQEAVGTMIVERLCVTDPL